MLRRRIAAPPRFLLNFSNQVPWPTVVPAITTTAEGFFFAMKNYKFPNDSYVNIMGWMINELQLSGNMLICYAVIHGFSKDRESEFRGGRKYLAAVMGCSLQTVTNTLQKLEANGLIIRREEEISGVIFCRYRVNYDKIPAIGGGDKNFDHPSNDDNGVDKNFEGGIVKNFDQGIDKNFDQGIVKNFDPRNTIIRNTIIGNTKKGNISPISETQNFETQKDAKAQGGDEREAFKKDENPKSTTYPLQKMKEMWLSYRPEYKKIWVDTSDMPALRQIGLILCSKEVSLVEEPILTQKFQKFLFFLGKHNFYKDKPLKTIANNIQAILGLMNTETIVQNKNNLQGADFFKQQEKFWQ
jgi:hypothetical protein